MNENTKNNIDNILSFYPNAILENDKVSTFTSFNEEVDALKDGIGIRNISDKNIFSLSGKDVLEFLNRISTNQTLNLPTAGILQTLFTNEKGRLIDRTTLVGLAGKYLLFSDCNCDTKLKRWIERYVIMEDVKVELVTGDYFALEFYGRQAESFLTMFCGDSIELINEKTITLITLEDSQFFLYKRKEKGIDRFILFAEMEYGNKIIDSLLNNKSVFNVSFIGSKAYNYFRIKNGIPKTPNELNDSYNPHEAGLIDEVSNDKGCYIGQEVIARLDTYDKVQRELKVIECEGKVNIDNGVELPIFDSKKNEVGSLTSVEYLSEENRSIGLAYFLNKYKNDTESGLYIGGNGHSIKVNMKKIPV